MSAFGHRRAEMRRRRKRPKQGSADLLSKVQGSHLLAVAPESTTSPPVQLDL